MSSGDLFSDTVALDLSVLSAFMKDQIGSNLYDLLVVTKECG